MEPVKDSHLWAAYDWPLHRNGCFAEVWYNVFVLHTLGVAGRAGCFTEVAALHSDYHRQVPLYGFGRMGRIGSDFILGLQHEMVHM